MPKIRTRALAPAAAGAASAPATEPLSGRLSGRMSGLISKLPFYYFRWMLKWSEDKYFMNVFDNVWNKLLFHV